MNYLSKLTSAEIYILTNEKATHKDFLKITLIDLLLKKVLKTIDVDRQPHLEKEIRTYKYVAIGANFYSYFSKKHEKCFIETFEKDNCAEILFRNLVKIGYEKSCSKSDFRDHLLKTDFIKKCVKQHFFQLFYSGYNLSEYGIEIKRQIDNEIKTLNIQFAPTEKIDSEKMVDLIKTIGANVFLIDNFDYDLLNQIDQDLSAEMRKNQNPSGDSGCGFGGFDDYSSSFDSGCGSHDGGSGCSGDSGCGGCGGCGGD